MANDSGEAGNRELVEQYRGWIFVFQLGNVTQDVLFRNDAQQTTEKTIQNKQRRQIASYSRRIVCLF